MLSGLVSLPSHARAQERPITPRGSAFVIAGTIRAPEPEVAPDPNFNILTERYNDSVRFRVPMIPRASGAKTLALNISVSEVHQCDAAESAGAPVCRTGHRQRTCGPVRHAAPVVRAAPRGARTEPAGEIEKARAGADVSARTRTVHGR